MKNKKVIIISILILVIFAGIIAVSVYSSKQYTELQNEYYEETQDDSVNITIEEDDSFVDNFVIDQYNGADWRIDTDVADVDKEFVYNYIVEHADEYSIDSNNINEIEVYPAYESNHYLYVFIKAGGKMESIFIDK